MLIINFHTLRSGNLIIIIGKASNILLNFLRKSALFTKQKIIHNNKRAKAPKDIKMANGNVGRPEKEIEDKRDAPVTFRVTQEQKELLNFVRTVCGYKTTGLFLYNFMLSILEHEKFHFLIPGKGNEELRIHYRNASTNLNLLKRDFYYLAERGKESEAERAALREALTEHHQLTKQLYQATFKKQVSKPITSEFWQKIKLSKARNNVVLSPIAASLKSKNKMSAGQDGSPEHNVDEAA
jgi:hypothetical protein